MENRGLLTEDDRAFWRGEKDVDDYAQAAARKRYHINQRIDRLEEDIKILRQAGEDEVVSNIYQAVGRFEQLEQEIEELRDLIEDDT